MTYTTQPVPITAVVLAAGVSRRMGAHKLLMPLAGRPLITWSVLAACSSQASDVLVILGRDSEDTRDALPAGRYHAIVNSSYPDGQGTSLALAATLAPPNAAGIAVLLADQPFMTADALDRVLEAARQEPDRIIRGASAHEAGHPVYLPARLFNELRRLTGDAGARDIVARERANIRSVTLGDTLAQFDVDTAEDYQRALSLAHRLAEPPS